LCLSLCAEFDVCAAGADGQRTLYGLVIGGIAGEEQGTDIDCAIMYDRLCNTILPHTVIDSANIHTFSYNCDSDPTNNDEIRKYIDYSFANTDDDDLSVLFYSGHDVSNNGIPGLCTSADPDDPGYYFFYPWDSVLSYLLGATQGDVVVFIDACFADGIIQNGLSSIADEDLDRLTIFAACEDGEEAFPRKLGLIAKGNYVSCFTHEIGNSTGFYNGKLRGDKNGDGLITVEELYNDIADRVAGYEGTVQGTSTKLKMHSSYWTRNPDLVLFGNNPGPNGEDIYGETQYFNAEFEDGKYVMYDSVRDIEICNANNSTLEKTLLLIDSDENMYEYSDSKSSYVDQSGNAVITEVEESGSITIKNEKGDVIGRNAIYAVRMTTINPFIDITRVTSKTAKYSDKKAVTLMSRLSAIYDFWKINYGRESFDDARGSIVGIYNDHKFIGFLQGNSGFLSSADSSNADSVGNKALGMAFFSFGTDNEMADDTIAHEFAHSVEKSISVLDREGESGALAEGIADIYGEIFEDWYDDGEFNNSCNWQQSTYRNLQSPSQTNNPERYGGSNWADPENLDYDNGGVHKNSTLLSRAAYLMSVGIDGSSSFEPLDTHLIGRLILDTLELIPSDCNYHQFRMYCEQAAEALQEQGALSEDQKLCVANAFFQVGIERDWLSIDMSGYLGWNFEVFQYEYPEAAITDDDFGSLHDEVLFDLNPIDGTIAMITLNGKSEYTLFGTKIGMTEPDIDNIISEGGWINGPIVRGFVTYTNGDYIIGYIKPDSHDEPISSVWCIRNEDIWVLNGDMSDAEDLSSYLSKEYKLVKDRLPKMVRDSEFSYTSVSQDAGGELSGLIILLGLEDRISEIILTSIQDKYTINGIYPGMNANDAIKILKDDGYSFKKAGIIDEVLKVYGEYEFGNTSIVFVTNQLATLGNITTEDEIDKKAYIETVQIFKTEDAPEKSATQSTSGNQSKDDYISLLPGAWYEEGASYASFILYSDGTCEISGEYGLGTWNVVNGNLFRLSNIYGESETATIDWVNENELHLSDGGYTSVFYRKGAQGSSSGTSGTNKKQSEQELRSLLPGKWYEPGVPLPISSCMMMGPALLPVSMELEHGV